MLMTHLKNIFLINGKIGMKKTQQNFTTIQYLSSTALRSIQTIKKTALLLIAGQAFVLSVQAFDHDQNDAAASTTTTTSSTTMQTSDNDIQTVPASQRTTNMSPEFAVILNTPNELLLRLTDFMDDQTLRSFKAAVNGIETMFHADNNHRDQDNNLEANARLQDAAITSHIFSFAERASTFIRDQFGENENPILTIFNRYLKTNRIESLSLIESLISPQNQEIIRSCNIVGQLINPTIPDYNKLLMISYAKYLFAPDMTEKYISNIFGPFSSFLSHRPTQDIEMILINLSRLFPVNASHLYNRNFMIRMLYNKSADDIRNLLQTVLYYQEDLLLQGREGWDKASMIINLGECDHYQTIAAQAKNLFVPGMDIHEINEIITALKNKSHEQIIEIAENFTPKMDKNQRLKHIQE